MKVRIVEDFYILDSYHNSCKYLSLLSKKSSTGIYVEIGQTLKYMAFLKKHPCCF